MSILLMLLIHFFIQQRPVSIEAGRGRCSSGCERMGNVFEMGDTEASGCAQPRTNFFGGQLAVLVPYVQAQLDQMLQSFLPDGSGYSFDSAARFRLEVSKFGENSAAIGGAVLVYQAFLSIHLKLGRSSIGQG